MIESLDPRQIVRIESVHRGFLYQHLYAAGCLLLADSNGIQVIGVERDEDIELVTESNRRLYVQVKTRSSPLILSDITDALTRFEAIRGEHDAARRSGSASFFIVSNVAPGPELRRRIENADLAADVRLVWPGAPTVDESCLPPAWENISAAARWCADRARSLPMALLEPETLVWKLAGRIMLAATGGPANANHSFSIDDLPALFEQLVIQLQQFPSPPDLYRPQEDEPNLQSPERVRIVSGFSGAGKTAWAAEAALHTAGACAYFDVGDVPGPAIASSLVRELAAQWASHEAGALRRVLLPGATGIDTLRALDTYLANSGSDALVVLDNAHRVPVSDLRMLIDATRHLKFVMLAQPAVTILEIEATLGVVQEMLRGWSLDEIAAEVNLQAAHGTVLDHERLRVLTGGLPLYVQTAARLSTTQYNGDIGAMCSAVEAQTNLVATSQEIILTRLFEALPDSARDVAAVLAISDVPLSEAEAGRLIDKSLGISAREFAAAIRQLRPLGVVRVFSGQRLQIHDALRVLGLSRLNAFPAPKIKIARETLKELIIESFEQKRDQSRFPLYVRTLVELGELKTLIYLATEEWFHELGISAGIWESLDAAAHNEAIDAEQRFYALDGLVFADMKSGNIAKVQQRLHEMQRLIDENGLGARELLVVRLKQMLFDADQGREKQVMEALQQIKEVLPDNAAYQRIFRYNVAWSFLILKRYDNAERIAHELVVEYYDVLGLEISDVMFRSNKQISEKLVRTDSRHDDLKHLADSLDVCAKCANVQGRDSGLARVHAAKFYGLANAISSFINVNQDLVDEFIGRSDYVGAREVIEQHLLPVVLEHKMMEKILSVRSQYAVVLAYCGDYDSADAELARLDPYRLGLSQNQCAEIDNQKRLVVELRTLKVRPGMVNTTPAYIQTAGRKKIGRNDPCPCGSGRKYKRCHG